MPIFSGKIHNETLNKTKPVQSFLPKIWVCTRMTCNALVTTKQPSLKLKTRPNPLGSLLSALIIPENFILAFFDCFSYTNLSSPGAVFTTVPFIHNISMGLVS